MAAADAFADHLDALMAPVRSGFAITPSDADELDQVTRAIYVGGTGDLVVILADDSAEITFKAVPVGTWLWIRAKQVKDTDTTATLLLGLA